MDFNSTVVPFSEIGFLALKRYNRTVTAGTPVLVTPMITCGQGNAGWMRRVSCPGIGSIRVGRRSWLPPESFPVCAPAFPVNGQKDRAVRLTDKVKNAVEAPERTERIVLVTAVVLIAIALVAMGAFLGGSRHAR